LSVDNVSHQNDDRHCRLSLLVVVNDGSCGMALRSRLYVTKPYLTSRIHHGIYSYPVTSILLSGFFYFLH